MGCLQCQTLMDMSPYLLLSLLEPFARLRLKVSFMGSRHTSLVFPNISKLDGDGSISKRVFPTPKIKKNKQGHLP